MLVLDANILIRAILGHRVRELLDSYSPKGIRFFAPDVAFEDAHKYLPHFAKKREKPQADLTAALEYLRSLIEPVTPEFYAVFETEARQRLRGRDESDWPVLASALALACSIWTEDADFFGTGSPSGPQVASKSSSSSKPRHLVHLRNNPADLQRVGIGNRRRRATLFFIIPPRRTPVRYHGSYKDPKVKPDFAQYGFVHQENLIMACIGGSQAHGAKLGATDDTDWYGLYIPPPINVLGLEREEHFVFTTGGKLGGNGPQDVDVCLYTLMKWAGLAAKGNPSALHFLFAPLEFTTKAWDRFRAQPETFLAKSHVKPFLGFADDQMKRLLGQKGQKNVHRAELEEKHGYDTKYAMHVIRLYGEAKELMDHGRITLPRPNRDELIEIRKGKYSLAEIQALGAQLRSEALAAQETSPLPDKVDRNAINRLLADAHLQFWSSSAA